MPTGGGDSTLRRIELLGAVSLATDLGSGQPAFHGLRTSVLAVAIGRALGWDDATVAAVQEVALLRFVGCTADTWETARMTGGDDLAFLAGMAPVAMGAKSEMGRQLIRTVGEGQGRLRRAALMAGALSDPGGAKRSLSAHCEVAAMLAERLGSDPEVCESLSHGHERWDGAGFPDGLSGQAVPLAVRVAVVARDCDLSWPSGPRHLTELLSTRRGRAYDSEVVDAAATIAPDILSRLDGADCWQAMLDAAPTRAGVIEGQELERALGAVADFADLKSPWTRGHSPRVAELAGQAATLTGLSPDDIAMVQRAGLVHDLGHVGVPNGIWDRPGPLGVAEWDRVRLHSRLTESTLSCCPALAALGQLAGAHHERLDGSGYHRGQRELTPAQRILGAADMIAAMGEDRPHRPALSAAEMTDAVQVEVSTGRLDRATADAVLTAAGHRSASPPRRGDWPAGLSDREVDVLRLIARGRTNKEVAAALFVSAKTVGRHIENLYAKIGANSRAAAAVFAMEHRLLDP